MSSELRSLLYLVFSEILVFYESTINKKEIIMRSRKNVSRIISLILLVVLLGGMLEGCGKRIEEGTTSSTETSTKEDIATSTEKTDANSGEEATLDVFIDQSWWPVSESKGIIPEAIEAATGVKINLTVTADDNQLGLMIASGELPDMVVAGGNFDRLSNSQLCYPYEELFEKTGVQFEMDDARISIGKSLSKDGQYYTVLSQFSPTKDIEAAPIGVPGQPCVFYRQDIYEAIGSPKMETLDDFLNVCELVKQKYPDMTPLGLGGWWKFQSFSFWLGAAGSLDFMYTDDGNVVYKTSAPAYKEYLKYANTLATKGYITAEGYAENNEANTHAMAYNNGCFAYPWYIDAQNLTQLQSEASKINPDAKWSVMKPLGKPAFNTWKGWLGMFVSRNCKNPEAAAKVISFLTSQEGQRLSRWGREGIDYTLDANGVPKYSDEYLATRKDPAVMNEKYNQWFHWGIDTVTQMVGDFSGLDPEILAAYEPYKVGYKIYPEIHIAVPTSDSDEGILLTKLNDIAKTEEVTVIFAANSDEFEKNYEKLMKFYEDNGVKTLDTYMTKKVKEVKEKYGF